MEMSIPCSVCSSIFNHTLLCEFHQDKLLLHLTIPFEEKPKTNLPSDNLKYYRQRKQMTTRQLAEKLDIVPSTVVMYENKPLGKYGRILIIVILILSFPIRDVTGMIRCNITNVEAVVCLYCRKFSIITYKSVIYNH